MAEYRSVRLICKHFNFTGDYVQEEMEVGDYFCYLAEALDAEELEDYRDALLTGGKEAAKKWKWATPDHAGTRAVAIKKQDVRSAIINFAEKIAGGPLNKAGTISEIAMLKGKTMVYRDEHGNIIDEQGNPVEVPKGMVFIPVEEGKPN